MSHHWLKNLFKLKTDECRCEASSINLSEAIVGSTLRIECLHGEEGTCQRLREMGFCEAAQVEKIADSGSLICRVCDSKVAISRDLARNIIVKDICQLKGHRSMEEKFKFLSQLSAGQKGIIQDFVIDSEDSERIQEMGLTTGEEIEIIRYAPLGDPIEIKIRGYLLSLRKQEADQIKVKISS